MSESAAPALPRVIAGPMVRQVNASSLSLWLVTSEPQQLSLELQYQSRQQAFYQQQLTSQQQQQIQIGQRAFIQLVHIQLPQDLIPGEAIEYDLKNGENSLLSGMRELCYANSQRPHFVYQPQVKDLLHGSCRKPHHDSSDGLLEVDRIIQQSLEQNTARPAMLMMTGDQVYADDVAGPMLHAIHQVIAQLGLFDESWQGAAVNDSQALYRSDLCFYQREQLLPYCPTNKALYDKFFAASKKPIFTSVNSHNHLVTLAEVFAMYILVWSPAMWELVDLESADIPEPHQQKYQQELTVIRAFAADLPRVRRALAHIPCYMIFDDHDVTDDWNLTRAWEEAAYGHPFSKRILGNALIGYWLCQGWGNNPPVFEPLLQQQNYFTADGWHQQDQLIDQLFAWGEWHFCLDTQPKVVVLDTRTHRWRSESDPSKPSGLMDWEALTALQQELIDQPEVIIVSPAPVYGVKLIEAIQRFFTFWGQALMVDAENWMAHPGTANVMLNIFQHAKTAPRFIILSGDVHYSFLYRVTPWHKKQPLVLQITSSGIKNQFPEKLLRWLDKLNRWLYASRSPLNWFTKRRKMQVKAIRPQGRKFTTLVNASGIGRVSFTRENQILAQVISEGKTIDFPKQ